MRRFLLALLLLCFVAPGCRKSSGDSAPPVDFHVYFLRQNYLADAFVSGNDWSGGEFLDSNLVAAASVPGRIVSGTTVTYTLGVRFVVYIKLAVLYSFDVTTGISQICNESNAGALVALIDTGTTSTSTTTTYALYTTAPALGVMDLKAVRVSGPAGSTPATLETAIPDTTTFAVRVPRDASNVFYYTLSGATASLKRCSLAAYPAATVTSMSAADDVLEFFVRDSTRVVYRRAAGEIMKADVGALPATVLVTPAASETLGLKGRIESGVDSEIFFTSHVDTNADTVPDQVTLKRAIYSSGALTTFSGPFSYATLTLNRVWFTGSRVIWEHIRDVTSFLTSFDRATPATNSNLLTGGRSLDASANTYVFYDAAVFRVLFVETIGVTRLRVAKTETGGLLNEYTFTGTAGATDAINHLGTSYYDASLDLGLPLATARLCFVDGTILRSLKLDMSAVSQADLGTIPGDIASLTLGTSFRAPTCLVGTAIAPVQTEIFYFRADAASSMLRQTDSPENETAIGAN